jgi:arsenate reductase
VIEITGAKITSETCRGFRERRDVDMLTFICYPKCSTCQKAKALLDSYHAQYETRDIKTDNPSYDELKGWFSLSGLPIRKFFNTSGQLYKSLNLKDKLPSMSEDECLKLLATDGMLVKRPLFVDEFRALVGFKPDEWDSVFTEYDRKKLDTVFNDYITEMLKVIKDKEEKGEITRQTRIVSVGNGNVAVMDYEAPILIDGQSALNFAVTVREVDGCDKIAVKKEMLAEDFFDLSSGIAGEIAQKLVNYDIRLAVIGDFSVYTSKALHDFIYESNKGGHLYFVADEDEAIKKLGDC